MSVSNDLGTGVVDTVDLVTEYPMDKDGHLLDKYNPGGHELITGWDSIGKELPNMTSPYGFLEFAIGNIDDFTCFDFRELKIGNNTYIILDSTRNSKTGHYNQCAEYHVMTAFDAIKVAKNMTKYEEK